MSISASACCFSTPTLARNKSPLTVEEVRPTPRTRFRSLLCAVLASITAVTAIGAAQPAAAASTYSLKWSFNGITPVLNLNDVQAIQYSKGASAAPDPSARATAGHPCSAIATSTVFGKVLQVRGNQVTNGRSTQFCDVTLSGGANASYTPNPASIKQEYTISSSAAIDFSKFAAEPNNFWCVTKCNYIGGVNKAITRDRTSKVCTQWAQAQAIGTNGNWETRGTAWPVTCPQWITITSVASIAGGESFDVTATSNLGLNVTLSESGDICKVTQTNTVKTHKVTGLKKGSCKLTASVPASTDIRSYGPMYASASATRNVKITKSCKKNCPVDADLEQTISHNAPADAMEYDAFDLGVSATSGLPVTLTLADETKCGLYNTAVFLFQYATGAVCTITASQPGNDDYVAAEDVVININIGCSPDHTCYVPPPPAPPVAQPDEFSFAYGDAITGNLTANDSIFSDGTKVALVSNSSSGSASIDATSGNFTFQPTSKYFTGSASFTYQLTDTMQQSSAAVTVALSVVAPPPPAPPTPDATLGVRAAAWMRLNADETITLLPTLSCGAASVQGAKCGTYASNGGIVGSYVEVTSMRVTGFNVTLPSAYPTSRYTLITDPTGDKPAATAFASGVAAKVKFQQATTANAPIKATLAYTASYKTVTWTQYNGVLVETVVSSGNTLFANASAQFGVIGATS